MICHQCSQSWKGSRDRCMALPRRSSRADSACRQGGSSHSRIRSWEWGSWSAECWLAWLHHFCRHLLRQKVHLANIPNCNIVSRAGKVDLKSKCQFHQILLTFDAENVHELSLRLHVLLEFVHSDLLAVSAAIRRCSAIAWLLLLHPHIHHIWWIARSISNHVWFTRPIALLWTLHRICWATRITLRIVGINRFYHF